MPGPLHTQTATARLTNVQPFALVGIGGAIGSLARHGVITVSDTSVAIFVLNLVGSLALGSVTAWLQHGRVGEAKEHWAALLGLGFCGGLTTFSTHMVDVAERLDASASGEALLSLAATAVLAVVAAGGGYEATRRSFPPTVGTTR